MFPVIKKIQKGNTSSKLSISLPFSVGSGIDFIKPNFHTCVNTTAQRRSTPFNVWTPMLTNNPSFCNKSLHARMKVALVELFRGDMRLFSQCAVTATQWKPRTQDTEKIFCPPQKKRPMQKNNFIITTTFRKSLFIPQYRMRYAIYIPLNAKDHAIGLTMIAYRNRQKRNKVCTNKQLRFVASIEILNGNQALQL